MFRKDYALLKLLINVAFRGQYTEKIGSKGSFIMLIFLHCMGIWFTSNYTKFVWTAV